MLNEKLAKMMSEQINLELYSAYLYMSFAGYFKAENLDGFGHWYDVQAMEELGHAKKFYDYMIDQGRVPELSQIPKPQVKVKNMLSLGKEGLKHEELVTASINKLYDAASDIKDHRTEEFLDWFIDEQAEEEVNACSMVHLLEKIEDNKAAQYFADLKMAKRE